MCFDRYQGADFISTGISTKPAYNLTNKTLEVVFHCEGLFDLAKMPGKVSAPILMV